VALADVKQQKVGLTRPAVDSESAQLSLEALAPVLYLRNIAGQVRAVGERGRQYRQRDCIHAVVRRDTPHHGHLLRRTGEYPDAQTRQTIRLGKRTRHEQVRYCFNVEENSVAMELEVSFVHQHGGIGRSVGNLEKLIAGGNGPGWVVGAGD